MTHDKRAELYAGRIREAAQVDRLALRAGLIKEAAEFFPRSNVARELQAIGSEIEGLVWSKDKKPLTEADKAAIAAATAEKLGRRRPLRRVFKEASVQHFLAILSDIEALIEEEG